MGDPGVVVIMPELYNSAKRDNTFKIALLSNLPAAWGGEQ